MTKNKNHHWWISVAWIIFVLAACSTHEDRSQDSSAAAVVLEPSQRQAKVLRVIDGDTIECCIELASKAELGSVFSVTTSCRLHGINAPDTHPDGSVKTKASTENLKNLVSSSSVDGNVLVDLKGRDKYGRTLIVVWAGGTSLNQKQIDQGHAVVYLP